MSKNTRKNISPYLALAIILIVVYFISSTFGTNIHKISYSKFQTYLKKDKVETINISTNAKGGTYDITGKIKGYKNNESYYVIAPLSDETMVVINKYQDKNKIKVDVKSDPTSGIFFTFIINVLPYLLIGGALLWFLGRQLSSNNKSMDFGKSRAKLQSDKNKVTFENVAGLTEFFKESKKIY